MLKNRCTQQKAEEIYLRQLEKNKKIRGDNESPKRVSKVPGNEEYNYLGIKSIYENIIHAAPSRAGSGSRA